MRSVDFAMFLVDLFCLGVKDAAFQANVGESYLKELFEERLPEDCRERLDPACAKKLVEGALVYAESLASRRTGIFARPQGAERHRRLALPPGVHLRPRRPALLRARGRRFGGSG